MSRFRLKGRRRPSTADDPLSSTGDALVLLASRPGGVATCARGRSRAAAALELFASIWQLPASQHALLTHTRCLFPAEQLLYHKTPVSVAVAAGESRSFVVVCTVASHRAPCRAVGSSYALTTGATSRAPGRIATHMGGLRGGSAGLAEALHSGKVTHYAVVTLLDLPDVNPDLLAALNGGPLPTHKGKCVV